MTSERSSWRGRAARETTTDPARRTWSFTPRMPGHDLLPGPWDDEPDKIQWVDSATDLDCLMLRNHLAAWCGYVGVPRTHPLHGTSYDQVDIAIHGGLTFSDRCAPGEPIDGICHIAAPGRETSPWWFGFDCGHYGDLQPGMMAMGMAISGVPYVYCTEKYVQAEVERLAEQLVDCGPSSSTSPH